MRKHIDVLLYNIQQPLCAVGSLLSFVIAESPSLIKDLISFTPLFKLVIHDKS